MLQLLLTVLVIAAIAAVGTLAGGTIAYLLTLLSAAAQQRQQQRQRRNLQGTPPLSPGSASSPSFASSFVVVIPAHNEREVIVSTLRSLAAQEYPSRSVEIVVVADNCTDETADLARSEGATVLERTNADLRGKGYALEWAFGILLARANRADGYVIVDADTFVSPDFLTLVADALFNGKCEALQGRYGVLNTQDSWRSALMTAAFDLFNHVKPLGRDRLGWGVGLKGNGMAFTRSVLERARWKGSSITEDIDYGLDLLLHHGIAVAYLPAAAVRAQMPVSAQQSASQRERWEQGRYRLLRERALPLLLAGVRKRDFRLTATAIDLLAPPLAELAALHLVWGALAGGGAAFGLLPGNALWWVIPPAVSALGFVLYVVAGLKIAGAPREAFTALLRAPLYIAWKLALYVAGSAKNKARKGQWVRTERIAIPTEGNRKSAP